MKNTLIYATYIKKRPYLHYMYVVNSAGDGDVGGQVERVRGVARRRAPAVAVAVLRVHAAGYLEGQHGVQRG